MDEMMAKIMKSVTDSMQSSDWMCRRKNYIERISTENGTDV